MPSANSDIRSWQSPLPNGVGAALKKVFQSLSEHLAKTPLSLTAAPLNTTPLIQYGVTSVTWASGLGTLTFPTPFPNGCTVVLAIGHGTASWFRVSTAPSATAVGLEGWASSAANTHIANGAASIEWIALGF